MGIAAIPIPSEACRAITPPGPDAHGAAFSGHLDFYATDGPHRDAGSGDDEDSVHAHIPGRAGEYLFAAGTCNDLEMKRQARSPSFIPLHENNQFLYVSVLSEQVVSIAFFTTFSIGCNIYPSPFSAMGGKDIAALCSQEGEKMPPGRFLHDFFILTLHMDQNILRGNLGEGNILPLRG